MIIMINIQQLFDKRYSETEKKAEEIQFSDLSERIISASELTIKNFPKLKKVNISNVKSLTKLKIINCPQLVGINCQNNVLLTNLDLSECNELMKIQVSSNSLELIKLPTNSETLLYLEINDNNFPSQDLSFLTPYKNLEILDLGNNSNEERVKKGIYNRFCGGIKGTDIDSGLEYLPENLQRLNCLTGIRVEAKVKQIHAICGTSSANNSSFNFDREKYKKFRQEQKIKTEQEEIEKLWAKIQELNEQLTNSNSIIEEKDKKISKLISENEKVKEETKDLLSKKEEVEKELKEKIKKWRCRELEELNNKQSKDYIKERIDWKRSREELEQVIKGGGNKNQVLQQQVASYQDKLKTLQGDLQNNRSNYANFINKNLQIKEKEVEELK
ncbi:1553_t:CDS:2, partial [Funneliformis geosporum]